MDPIFGFTKFGGYVRHLTELSINSRTFDNECETKLQDNLAAVHTKNGLFE